MCYLKALLITTFCLISAADAYATTHEAAQIDWSGGPGVPGPVTAWADTFDTEANVSWLSFPGELHLSSSPITPVVHFVDNDFDGPTSVRGADIDGDGDMDVLAAAGGADDITWWSNDDGSGTSWTEYTVNQSFDGAISVYAADVDDDGDLDVMAAASIGNDITWWSNDDGSGTSWTEYTIDGDFDGAFSVYAADIDDDGDLDVMAAASNGNDITWWSNDNGSGTSWTEYTIDGDFDDASSVYAADVDGDGDMDVLGAANDADDITWWSNDDGSGTSWTEHTVDGNFNGPRSVYAEDVDSDGDMDVLGAACYGDDIAWWSNDGGSGTYWTKHMVDDNFDYAISVYAEDVDGDGDMDVLGVGTADDDITWWSNDDGSGTSWTEHTTDGSFDGAHSVYAADMDDDGDMDILGAAYYDDDITWWEVTEFLPSAELVSSIYDTEGSPEWGWIDWNEDMPPGTNIKFQVRSSDDSGSMGSWSAEIVDDSDLSGILTDGDRYVQYKTVLETTDSKLSPTLYDITIDWGYTDVTVTSFSAASAEDGIGISWECARAVSGFNLYRSTGLGSGKTIASRDKLNAGLITGESPYAYLDGGVEEGEMYSYWLEAIDVGASAETFGPAECKWNGALPTTYALYQSRPNPATGNAIIAFDLPEDTGVTLAVYDISGRKVTTVVDHAFLAGKHEVEISGLTAGVYIYKLDAEGFSAVKKMVVDN